MKGLFEYIWKEFFSNDFSRNAEGVFSQAHLLLTGLALLCMVGIAYLLSRKSPKQTNDKILKAAAALMVGAELIKLILLVFIDGLDSIVRGALPLYMCSIALFALPVAAFSKGTVRASMRDFVLMFGILGAVMGTVLGANIFNHTPVIHFKSLVSVFTHCMAGFSGCYIAFTRGFTFSKKTFAICAGVLASFMIAAGVVNVLVDGNYMFMMRSDGTPFSIIGLIFKEGSVGYAILIALLYLLYIAVFGAAAALIRSITERKRKSKLDNSNIRVIQA